MRHFAQMLLATAAVAALAQPARAEEAAAEAVASGSDEIVVLGFGQTRQVQSLSAADISLRTPGTSPLKAVQSLPGVNFQSADGFGAYEWSTRISLRGFNQNQLGFTLDGVPLGDMSYGNHNGLHISRAIISENIGRVDVSQGAGNLATASTSNLGGTLVFASRAPADRADIVASGTYGSDDSWRAYVRAESGDLGGIRSYLSYAYLDAGKWKGDGRQRQHQVNAKAVADLGDGHVTAFVNFSDRRENDYQDMSAAMIRRLGRDWDNISNDWATAYRIGAVVANYGAGAGPLPYPQYGLALPAPFASPDDAYFDASGLRRDWLGGITLETPVSEHVGVKVQGYYHNNHGQGLWWTPYTPTPGGAPISIRSTEYDMKRTGVLAEVDAELGFNTIRIGGWYEHNNFHQARRFYGLDDVLTGSSRSSLDFQSDPFATGWEYEFATETLKYHVMDEITLGDLLVSLGWKGVRVTNQALPIVQGSLPAGTIRSQDWFQPQVGLLYRLGADAELFANYTENMAAFVSAATAGPFSTNQTGFNAIRNTLKPESSKTVEGGARLRSGAFQGALAGYYVDFSNRLLAVQVGSAIQGNPSALQNVGSVRSWGLEASGLYTVLPGLTLRASYAYNDTSYRDDVVNGDGVLVAAIKGKTAVDSPHHIASGDISYDGDIFFARLGANYMSKRYYTYTNDMSVGERVLVDASLGARIPQGHGFLSGFAIEVSATNLFDKDYVSTVGSGGFGNSGDGQTLLPGAPQQFFVTLRRGF